MLGAGEVVDLKFLTRYEKTRINQKMARGQGILSLVLMNLNAGHHLVDMSERQLITYDWNY